MKKALIAFMVLLSMAVCGCGEDSKKTNNTSTPTKQEQKVQTNDVKGMITSLCKDTLKDNFVRVSVNENYSNEPGTKGTKIVLITAKFQDSFSDNMTRKANILKARDTFKALYTSGQPISEAVYFAEAEFKDNYGKTSTGNVFKFKMTKKTAGKIDWNGVKDVPADSFVSVLDEVWMMPQFRKK